MNKSHALRIFGLIFLFILAQGQIVLGIRAKESSVKTFTAEASNYEIDDFPFDHPFPLINETAPEDKVKEAVEFLKLPTWSQGYLSCDDPKSEVSCFEIVRAAEEIKNYKKIIDKGHFVGKVYVDGKDYKPEDRMTMLYHAVQIGMVTKRAVYFDYSLLPFDVSSIVKNSEGEVHGVELPTDYQFGCANIGPKYSNLLINNVTWPQALYTHHVVAPFLRNNFGFHAAYFIGNYLFGTKEKPEDECITEKKYAVEAHVFKNNDWMGRPEDFYWMVPRCGINEDSLMLSNIILPDLSTTIFKEKYIINEEDDDLDGFVCGLRKMMSAERVIFTYGSRYGFWAAAMQGRKGGYANTVDRICVNVTNSQCGSLVHTYCQEDRYELFKANNRMFVCGPNVNDVRLYIDYLLW